MTSVPKVLDVAGVTKRFGAAEVLSDVSFQVDKGETVCVLGPSGSGKSTLLRCINWLERPDAGQIYLNGKPVGAMASGAVMHDRELSKLRTHIGMVFQHFALWPHLTVLQNITEAPIQVQKRPKAEAVEEALALLAKVGLADKRDAFPARSPAGRSSASASRARSRCARRPAVRRADQRARSRAGRRGAGGDARAGARGHDHGGGDARDGLRARCGDAGDLPRRGPRGRDRAAGRFFAQPQTERRASSCSAMPAASTERTGVRTRSQPCIRSSICCPMRRSRSRPTAMRWRPAASCSSPASSRPIRTTTQLPVPDGIEAQTRKVLDNLRACSRLRPELRRRVCVRIFLTDFKRDYAPMNAIYATYFAADKRRPAPPSASPRWRATASSRST
jgi:ABC-type lipoprotein export system ATPase subunit